MILVGGPQKGNHKEWKRLNIGFIEIWNAFVVARHPIPSAFVGHTEAFVPDSRQINHPAPHRGMRPHEGAEGDPGHRLLSGVANGEIRHRHAASLRY